MKSIYKHTFAGICLLSGIAAFGLIVDSQSAPAATISDGAGPSTGSPDTGGTMNPKRTTVFREHRITDQGLNDMVASTVLVPESWTIEGGITRPAPQFYSMPVLLDIKFIAPDGRQARQFPSYMFEFNNQQPGAPFSPTLNGNMYMPLPDSPGAWLMEMIRISPDPTISDLRLISEQMEPEMTRQLREKNAPLYRMVEQNRSMAAQTGFATEFDTQATILVLQYTQDAKQLEETILMTWQYMIHVWQGQVMSGTWSIGMMYSLRGPIGTDYINDPQLMAIFQSARPNPAWVEEMQNYWAELARIRNKGAADRRNQAIAAHRKRMQTLNETSDIIANGWKSRSAINDAGHSRYIDSIHEVTPYRTPAGKTVKLPSFYDHVYTDNDGRFILNNDAFYNPNTDPLVNQQNWQRVEREAQ